MKARIGDLFLEDLTAKDIVELARELNGHSKTKPEKPKAERPKVKMPSVKTKISPAQFDTWQWLVANDAPEGRSSQEYGVATGLSDTTANARMSSAVNIGIAYRVSVGRYRPGEPPVQESPVRDEPCEEFVEPPE